MNLYSGLQQPQSTPSAWERRLDGVRSIDELISVTRDYVGSLTPLLLARLPEDCRPGVIKYEDDIDFWAYRLAQRYVDVSEEPVDGALLHELFDYFLHALIRLTELHRTLPGTPRLQTQ